MQVLKTLGILLVSVLAAATLPPLLDADRIAEIEQCFPPKERAKLLAEVERETTLCMTAIRAHLSSADAAAARRAAHRIKGMAASFGANRLAELARQIELGQEISGSDQALDALEHALVATVDAFATRARASAEAAGE